MEAEKKPPTPFELFKADPVARFGEREIDLSKMKPFTLGDKKRLKKEFEITFGDVDLTDPEQETKLTYYLLRQCCPDLRLEEVDEVPSALANLISIYAGMRSGEINRPTSARSTSSPAPTDGAPAS